MARFTFILWRYTDRDALGQGGKDVAEGAAKGVTRRGQDAVQKWSWDIGVTTTALSFVHQGYSEL